MNQNCPNCGAPIEQDICPYCGTMIWDFATIELNEPRWVKIKHDGKIYMVRAKMTSLRVENKSEPTMFYADSRAFRLYNGPDYEIDLHMVVVPDDEGILAKIKEI